MVRTRAQRAAQRARRKSDGLFPRMGQAQEQARAPVAPFSKEPAQERTRAARAARRARHNYAGAFPGEGQCCVLRSYNLLYTTEFLLIH